MYRHISDIITITKTIANRCVNHTGCFELPDVTVFSAVKTKSSWKFDKYDVFFSIPYINVVNGVEKVCVSILKREVWVLRNPALISEVRVKLDPYDAYKGHADFDGRRGHALYCFDEDIRCGSDHCPDYQTAVFYKL